jgi:glyoxylase-like metal-dependent hydrolase (beta-lactamase superfamily II)
MRTIKPGFYSLALGFVNVFLIDTVTDGLILIDAGNPGDDKKILKAIEELGKVPQDLKHILVTHGHPDHAGALAALKKATGAKIWAHAADVELIERGDAFRPAFDATPGLLNAALFHQFIAPASPRFPPCEVDYTIEDEQLLPLGEGIRVLTTPGHSEGHVSFLWEHHGGVLFVGDAAINVMTLKPMIAYEDYEKGLKSLKKLASRVFDVACFGHGRPIKHRATQHFARKFGR